MPDNQEKPRIQRNPDGTFLKGVSANPAGRTKRKTLAERLHESLDRGDGPLNWDTLVAIVLTMVSNKDKDMIKELWHYTDGMPVQKQVLAGDEDAPLTINIDSVLNKVYGNNKPSSTKQLPNSSA